MGCSLHSALPWLTDLRGLSARVVERTVCPTGAGHARASWPERTSLVLQVRDAAGHVGLGEAAPLPGFSRETLEDARADLTRLTNGLVRAQTASLCASVQLALDTALLDLRGLQEGRPAWSLLRTDAAPEALVCNGLIVGPPDTWERELRALLERGVRCVKLKIGHTHLGVRAQIEALRRLIEGLPADVSIRLDANRGFGADDARLLRSELDDPRFEYVEDPVPADALDTLAGAGLGWAADELLLEAPARIDALGRPHGLVALILKPTILGSVARIVELVRGAGARNLDAVFTHSFEGPVGYAAAVHLAFAAAGPSPRAVGLAEHDVLRQWGATSARSDSRLARPEAPGLGLDPALRKALLDA